MLAGLLVGSFDLRPGWLWAALAGAYGGGAACLLFRRESGRRARAAAWLVAVVRCLSLAFLLALLWLAASFAAVWEWVKATSGSRGGGP